MTDERDGMTDEEGNRQRKAHRYLIEIKALFNAYRRRKGRRERSLEINYYAIKKSREAREMEE